MPSVHAISTYFPFDSDAPLECRKAAAWGGRRWNSSRMAAAMAGAWPGAHAHSCAASLSGSSHAFRCSISFSPAAWSDRTDGVFHELEFANQLASCAVEVEGVQERQGMCTCNG